MLAIVAPMAIELAAIRRSVPDDAARYVFFSVLGIGKKPAQSSIRGVLERRPHAIVLAGFCGGAGPNLKPGDLHVAQSFLCPDLTDAVEADAELNAHLSRAGENVGARVITGPSATVDAIASPGVKSRLYRNSGAASVNMEDYWIARAARSAGVPFASVRAVLDTAGVELPDYLSEQPVRPGRMLGNLIVHPGRIPMMVRFAHLARIARNSLTRCVLAAIESWSSERSALSAVPK